MTGLAALAAMRDVAQVGAGTRVLINGASGGVGTLAVQIAKVLGAEVTPYAVPATPTWSGRSGRTTSSTTRRRTSPRAWPRFDVILDNVLNHPPKATARVLAPQGVLIPNSIGYTGGLLAGLPRTARAVLMGFGSTTVKLVTPAVNRENLDALRRLLESGESGPVSWDPAATSGFVAKSGDEKVISDGGRPTCNDVTNSDVPKTIRRQRTVPGRGTTPTNATPRRTRLLMHWTTVLTTAAIIAALCVAGSSAPAQAAAPIAAVPLGLVATFGVLTPAAVGNAAPEPVTVVRGDIGAGGAITGFPPGIHTGSLSGTAAIGPALADLQIAFDNAKARPAGAAMPAELGGTTAGPGVHTTAAASGMAAGGTFTIDGQGDPNAVFIFQVGGALALGANITMNLIGGARAKNVYWAVTGAGGDRCRIVVRRHADGDRPPSAPVPDRRSTGVSSRSAAQSRWGAPRSTRRLPPWPSTVVRRRRR